MADTIRILVATDNHVGYAERDPVRSDDSWKTFHEIMCLAKDRDVDMVLLGGDLFHENKPSRKSMYNVMRSLRLNCYGDKPCELELLSDGSEHFDPTIGHANYEDPDINVAIPVFSIHGNHDDPSGEGLYAALDILEMAGLVNYFGRVPESDNITVKPLFFQKGNTKLALYGLSNVRDERLHRTFRDNKVTFKRPGIQQDDWFNLMCVHQNHTAHSETSYLPENQLPDYMDLIIWGHEHKCDPIAHKNPETGFKVLQPGSSIATSLIPGEADAKHAFEISVTGREFKSEPIRLKTVRPFVYKDLVLSSDKDACKIAKKHDHRSELTRYLERIVNGMIKEARKQWDQGQIEDTSTRNGIPQEFPKPLIRLRVETSSPDGMIKFELENPQRFSNRFADQVANRNDVIQLHARKKTASRNAVTTTKLDDEALRRLADDPESSRIGKLIRTYLDAQSLNILPQNYFTDAVEQFIGKDDKHAMELFVNESLAKQIRNLLGLHKSDEEEYEVEDNVNIKEQIEAYRTELEDLFEKGQVNGYGAARRYKPKPVGWEDDIDGRWEDQPGALIRADEDSDGEEEDGTPAPTARATRGKGAGRGVRGAARTTRGRGRAASGAGTGTTRATTSASSTRNRRAAAIPVLEDEDEDEDEDVLMVDSVQADENEEDEDDDSQALFVPQKRGTSTKAKPKAKASASTASTKSAAPATRSAPIRSTNTTKAPARSTTKTATPAPSRGTRQSQLRFGASQANANGSATGTGAGTRMQSGTSAGAKGSRAATEEIDDDDDDDDDAFEPVSSVRGKR